MLSPISLIYLSFDAPFHGGARGTFCFGRQAQITENVEGYLTPSQRTCEYICMVGPLTTIPPPKNRECRISLNYISFDVACHGDAGGTLRFCIRAVLSRKSWGCAGHRTIRRSVRTSTIERGISHFFRFRPRTPHSTRHPTAMPVVLSVFASGQFSAEKPGSGTSQLNSAYYSTIQEGHHFFSRITKPITPTDRTHRGDACDHFYFCVRTFLGQKSKAASQPLIP
jgi:hypothetical protein